MDCGVITHRQKLQDKLMEMNPGAAAAVKQMVPPPSSPLSLERKSKCPASGSHIFIRKDKEIPESGLGLSYVTQVRLHSSAKAPKIHGKESGGQL